MNHDMGSVDRHRPDDGQPVSETRSASETQRRSDFESASDAWPDADSPLAADAQCGSDAPRESDAQCGSDAPREPDAPCGSDVQRAWATPSAPPAVRLHVLIAEDNSTNRLVTTRMVQRMGHAADVVGDGVAAVEAACHTAYDVILMDMLMPKMDGVVATRRIRAAPHPWGQVPIIGLTGNDSAADETACRDAGMNAFLSKPVSSAQLAASIATVLPPPAAACGPPLLDEAFLRDLSAEIGADGTDEVVGLFLEQLPRRHQRIHDAICAGGDRLRREAHALSGAAYAVGLVRLGEAAHALQRALEETSGDAPVALELEPLLRETGERLAAWRAANPLVI